MSIVSLERIRRGEWSLALSPVAQDLLLSIGALFLLGALAVAAAMPVQVTVDGVADTAYTHRRTLAPLLADMGLELHQGDRVTPGPATPVQRRMAVTVERAPLVRILADGRDLTVATWAETPSAILADAGLALNQHDRAVLDGEVVPWDTPLDPAPVQSLPRTYDLGYAWDQQVQAPRRLRVYRSIPITVDDGGLAFPLRTTAQTVGEALRDAQITIYLGDRVQPSLGSPVSTGLRVFIERSTPLTMSADGRTMKTRTRAATVGDALSEMGIGIAGADRVSPPPETALYENIRIDVVRVAEDVEVTEEIAPFETIFEPDPNLSIDSQQVVNPGAEGITRTRYRVTYENGQEVERVEEDTWVAQEPDRRVIAYGQRIEPQTVTLENGQTITYWRRIRMLASSYSAGTAGVSPDQPWYGRTYSGDPMRFGVVAVDPSIIPLRSKVYVPGYGEGDALDIGSAIRARRIDLGYDDDNLVLWNSWVDVYLLWPPPADYQITWVLPNWPRVPQ